MTRRSKSRSKGGPSKPVPDVVVPAAIDTTSKVVSPKRTWSNFFKKFFTRKNGNATILQKNAWLLRSKAPRNITRGRAAANKHASNYAAGMGVAPVTRLPLRQTWKKVRGYNAGPPKRAFTNWLGSKWRGLWRRPAPKPANVPGFDELRTNLSRFLESHKANAAAKTVRMSKSVPPTIPRSSSQSRKSALSVLRSQIRSTGQSGYELEPEAPYERSKAKGSLAPGWQGSTMSKNVRAKLGLKGGAWPGFFRKRSEPSNVLKPLNVNPLLAKKRSSVSNVIGIKRSPVSHIVRGVNTRSLRFENQDEARNNGSRDLGEGKGHSQRRRWNWDPKSNESKSRRSVPKSNWRNSRLNKTADQARILATVESRFNTPQEMMAAVEAMDIDVAVKDKIISDIDARYPAENY